MLSTKVNETLKSKDVYKLKKKNKTQTLEF